MSIFTILNSKNPGLKLIINKKAEQIVRLFIFWDSELLNNQEF